MNGDGSFNGRSNLVANVGSRNVQKRETPARSDPDGRFIEQAGGDVLSHAVSHAVPSALRGLTSVFGMGTGVALALWPPAIDTGSRGEWIP